MLGGVVVAGCRLVGMFWPEYGEFPLMRNSSRRWYTGAFFLMLLALSLLRTGGAAGAVSGYILISFLPGLAFLFVLFGDRPAAVDSLLYAGVLS
ncbi:MAG: hypothetical protein KAX38_08605, partial [Candidatus Krumholzibacteria bacterium]|nr:hypothetical protein [Candidatus Krumholzibacteria bacterium]